MLGGGCRRGIETDALTAAVAPEGYEIGERPGCLRSFVQRSGDAIEARPRASCSRGARWRARRPRPHPQGSSASPTARRRGELSQRGTRPDPHQDERDPAVAGSDARPRGWQAGKRAGISRGTPCLPEETAVSVSRAQEQGGKHRNPGRHSRAEQEHQDESSPGGRPLPQPCGQLQPLRRPTTRSAAWVTVRW